MERGAFSPQLLNNKYVRMTLINTLEAITGNLHALLSLWWRFPTACSVISAFMSVTFNILPLRDFVRIAT
jgi:hypothetical protein